MKQFTYASRGTFHHTVFSNFSPARVTLDGIEYPTVEHAYQAAKTIDPTEREWVCVADRPGEAKRRGRKVTMRADWEAVKVRVMRSLLEQKFSDPERRQMLLGTGTEELVEGNNWHDNFWGMCTCGGPRCSAGGQNMLGQLLMEIRDR